MSTYVSLYRKYRPQSFGDVVGQGHITRILQNALEGGRVAHAYLFCGPRGTGKTTTARLLAKALNCAHGPARDPCNACNPCQRITAGSALDVIEIDAASNRGIDDIRDLREKVKYAPAETRHKVYVIDECHMLTTEAFNALLKTLEEPPPHVLFILATTDAQKVPATILSRCQRLDFRRGSVADLQQRLRVVADGEGLDAEAEALLLIARSADGSWRDALSILEQIAAFGARQVTAADVRSILGAVSADLIFRCAHAIAAEDTAGALKLAAQLADEGKDIRDFLRGLIAHFRNLLLVGAAGGAILPDGATVEEVRVLTEQAGRFSPAACLQALESLSEAEKEMRHDSQHRLLLEIAILRLACAPASPRAAAPGRDLQPAPASPISGADREASARGDAGSAPEAPPTSSALSPAESPAVDRATPAAAADSAAPRSLTLEKVLADWPLIVDRVGKPPLRGVLRDARPGRLAARELVLFVRPGYTFHREQLDKAENLRVVREAVCQVLGTQIAVRIEMEDAAATGERTEAMNMAGPRASVAGSRGGAPDAVVHPPSAEGPDPYDENTISVKDVLDLFRGKVIQNKEEW